MEDQQLLDAITQLALRAGRLARSYFSRVVAGRLANRSGIEVKVKKDKSLLSEADTALDDFIRQGLSTIAADIPIISEEHHPPDYAQRQHWTHLWLVDPLDGTRHFLAGNPDYTINIALIQGTVPVLGLIYAPSLGRCYVARKGHGAWLILDEVAANRPATRLNCSSGARPWLEVMVSHGVPGWRLRSYLAQHRHYCLLTLGSALKSCWVATGLADVYPRFGDTFEWDTAPAQLILNEAGGQLIGIDGKPLSYNKPSLLNPEFIAHAGWYCPPNPWYER